MRAGRGGYMPDEAGEYYLCCPSLFLCLSSSLKFQDMVNRLYFLKMFLDFAVRVK